MFFAHTRRRSTLLATIFAVSVWSPLGVHEAKAVPISAFQLDSFTPVTGNFYIGIEIFVTTPQLVSFLGVIDTNNDSVLNADVGVGIYSLSNAGSNPGTHVVSAIVPALTAVESIGVRGAFFVDVPDVTLSPGFYLVMADAGGSGEGFGGFGTTYTFQSGISYQSGRSGAEDFPGLGADVTARGASGGGVWPAGVFKVEVPEPSGVLLFGAEVVILGFYLRRRMRGSTVRPW